MGAEAISLDPVTEDAANAELALSTANGYYLLEHSYPPPPREIQWASSADTEGETVGGYRYRNREITVKLRTVGTTQADIAVKVQALQEKIAKMVAEGGTYKRTLPGGEIIVFDVLDVEADALFDNRFIHRFRTEMPVKFICKPFGRGAAVQLADHTETALPCLVFTDTGVKGDVPGLGKLVVDEDQAVDQLFLLWGQQCRYYDSATTAKLFYEAEALTALGTAAAAAGPSGASGAGSNTIFDTSLTTSYRAVLSTQATGGGSHMTHVGRFQVWARVQTPTANTGAVKVAFEWAEGDFRRYTRNDEVALYPDASAADVWEGTWRLVNLGEIDLAKVAQGTQRWEGRILALSTVAGDDIYVDHLMFVPVTEGYGEVRAQWQVATPSSFSARDEFDQTAGALNAKTAPVGGAWATSGDATDLTVETAGKTIQRAATVDVGSGRYAISGAAAFTAQVVQVDMKVSALAVPASGGGGAVARWTDISNRVRAVIVATSGDLMFSVTRQVAGVGTTLGTTPLSSFAAGAWWTIRILIFADGRWYAWAFPQGSTPSAPLLSGQDSVLATGGTLASGKVGIIDVWASASASTRNYDNFAAWVPVADAAVFASQSLEVRHDRVIREDSAGAIWTPVTDNQGSYLKVPPAGRDNRTVRMIVKACRNDPDTGPDSAIDDISARLTYTPRYLQVPEP